MSCTSPLLALDYGIDSDTGKHKIKILPKRADFNFAILKEKYGDMLLKLPCGKCDSCFIAKKKEWALRVMLEADEYKNNSFLTLTYDEEHYPSNYKKDFQKFIKCLRDKYPGILIRYFGCCEKGGSTGRFHLHIILFNYFPEDAKIYSKKDQHYYYSSQVLSTLWKKGFVLVGEVNSDVASYVAGYCQKKYKDKGNFILMSTKPGIGFKYYLNNKDKLHKYDSITFKSFKNAKIPRYFDKLDDKDAVDAFDLSLRKAERVELSKIHLANEIQFYGVDHEEKILNIKSRLMKDKLSRKKRGN